MAPPTAVESGGGHVAGPPAAVGTAEAVIVAPPTAVGGGVGHAHVNVAPSQGVEMATGPVMGRCLFATLDELWDGMPSQAAMDEELQAWGIFDATSTPLARQERYVRFKGVEFPMAPKAAWSQLRRDLLEFEP